MRWIELNWGRRLREFFVKIDSAAKNSWVLRGVLLLEESFSSDIPLISRSCDQDMFEAVIWRRVVVSEQLLMRMCWSWYHPVLSNLSSEFVERLCRIPRYERWKRVGMFHLKRIWSWNIVGSCCFQLIYCWMFANVENKVFWVASIWRH